MDIQTVDTSIYIHITSQKTHLALTHDIVSLKPGPQEKANNKRMPFITPSIQKTWSRQSSETAALQELLTERRVAKGHCSLQTTKRCKMTIVTVTFLSHHTKPH